MGTAALWEEFIRRFGRSIVTGAVLAASQCGERRAPQIEDFVQEIYCKLCADDRRILRQFQPESDDAAARYLRTVAANAVYEHFRGQIALKRRPEQGFVALEEMVPDRGSATGEMERQILISSVDAVLRAECSPRDHRIFWMYYRMGLTAGEIAGVAALGLETKGVEAVLKRLRDMVREKLRTGFPEGKPL